MGVTVAFSAIRRKDDSQVWSPGTRFVEFHALDCVVSPDAKGAGIIKSDAHQIQITVAVEIDGARSQVALFSVVDLVRVP